MSIADLKGYSVPFSPRGDSQVAGAPPWHFGVDVLAVNFQTDPEQIRKLLPEPLELSRENPGGAYVWFGDWQGLWKGREDMLSLNPERCLYTECLIGVRCSHDGKEGHRVVYIWVDKDFSMMRGWFMGFPKKIGKVALGTTNRHLHALNPGMPACGPGSKYAAVCEAHCERLVTASIEVTREASPADLPKPFGTELYHTIHYPSADVDGNTVPVAHQLIQTVSSKPQFGQIWEGKGEVTLHTAQFDEHYDLQPTSVDSAFIIPVGFSILGNKLVHSYDYGPEF
ncbi:MAG: acetoacetate decarboxylase family protein [Halioglobus sp.]|nr:acetoacetate decarboxylase family protein [Halioglobus sp.]